MSIATQLQRIKQAKEALKQAINAKGGTLTDEKLGAYAEAVSGLSTGGESFYKCASVEETTWSGYEAIQAEDGTWDFESAVTSDLEFGLGYTPEVGKVYNADATIEVGKYSKVSILSKASFYASLTENMDKAQSGQVLTSYNSPEFIEYEGKKCCAFYESQYFTANTEGVLTNQSTRTYSVEVYRGYNVHMKYILSHGSDNGYCFRCYSTNNGISIFGGGLDNNVYEQLPETWTRLTIVYTGTQWKVYFGTVLKMTVDLTVTEEPTETELLSIGAHLDGAGAYDGHMRNFTVFPFALTESEIAELQTAFD